MTLFDCSLDYARDVFRNIRGIRESQNLFDDLSADPLDWDAAISIEMETHPPLYQSQIIQRAFDYSKNNFIDYPFQHITSSRYSDGSFAVWYGSENMETSIHETMHHFLTEIEDAPDAFAKESVLRIDRKVGIIHCRGIALDLVPEVEEYPWLIHPDNYDECRKTGKRIAEEGHPLLRVPSARHQSGVNLAVFSQAILSNPRPHCGLHYEYDFKTGKTKVYRGDSMLMES